jgi:hypothetical protein
MAATPVTPVPGSASIVAAGGVAVVAVPGGPNGGFITNPYDAADQGISSAEPLYVDPVGTPGAGPGNGNGTTFVLYPGQSWPLIPGQTTVTRVNAQTSGHKFSVVYF